VIASHHSADDGTSGGAGSAATVGGEDVSEHSSCTGTCQSAIGVVPALLVARLPIISYRGRRWFGDDPSDIYRGSLNDGFQSAVVAVDDHQIVTYPFLVVLGDASQQGTVATGIQILRVLLQSASNFFTMSSI
jgi:hypothetical protein